MPSKWIPRACRRFSKGKPRKCWPNKHLRTVINNFVLNILNPGLFCKCPFLHCVFQTSFIFNFDGMNRYRFAKRQSKFVFAAWNYVYNVGKFGIYRVHIQALLHSCSLSLQRLSSLEIRTIRSIIIHTAGQQSFPTLICKGLTYPIT